MSLKPFAVSKRELFTLAMFVIRQQSPDKEDRKRRRELWIEMGLVDLKRRLMKILSPEETRAADAAAKADPNWRDPDGAYQWEWRSDEPTVRVELHNTTIEYLLTKVLNGPMDGPAGDVLGELSERLEQLKTTDAATICTDKPGSGYRLPRELWTETEQRRGGMKLLADEPDDEPAAG